MAFIEGTSARWMTFCYILFWFLSFFNFRVGENKRKEEIKVSLLF